MTPDIQVCLNCGMILDKRYNKRMKYCEVKGYCNDHCYKKKMRGNKPKARKKYGIAGTAYDFYHKDDIFKRNWKS